MDNSTKYNESMVADYLFIVTHLWKVKENARFLALNPVISDDEEGCLRHKTENLTLFERYDK